MDEKSVELAVQLPPSQLSSSNLEGGEDGKETTGKETTLEHFHLSAPPPPPFPSVFSPPPPPTPSCMIINDRVSNEKQDMDFNVANQV